jgi:hypothetical protein
VSDLGDNGSINSGLTSNRGSFSSSSNSGSGSDSDTKRGRVGAGNGSLPKDIYIGMSPLSATPGSGRD